MFSGLKFTESPNQKFVHAHKRRRLKVKSLCPMRQRLAI